MFIMEEHQPEQPVYMQRVLELNQGIFYCYNESSERLPISRVTAFDFKDQHTIFFNCTYFPVTENAWNILAAELHCYKKGIAHSIILHGIAVIADAEEGRVEFTIQHADYFGKSIDDDKGLLSNLFKPYIYFYRKSSEILLHPFKRKNTIIHL